MDESLKKEFHKRFADHTYDTNDLHKTVFALINRFSDKYSVFHELFADLYRDIHSSDLTSSTRILNGLIVALVYDLVMENNKKRTFDYVVCTTRSQETSYI